MSARPWYETAEPIHFERHKLPDGSEIVLVDEWPAEAALDLVEFEKDVPRSQRVMRFAHHDELRFEVHNGSAIYLIVEKHPENPHIGRLICQYGLVNRGEVAVQPSLPGMDT